MNKIRLAQALVPIADELDERELREEAIELDSIIEDLMKEAAIEGQMVREAQQTNLQQSWSNQAGMNSFNPGGAVGAAFQTPGAAVADAGHGISDWWRKTTDGVQGQQRNYQIDIARIDQQLLALRQQEMTLQQQKQRLMQQGQQNKGQVAQQFGLQFGPQALKQNQAAADVYQKQIQQQNKLLQKTQQVAGK